MAPFQGPATTAEIVKRTLSLIRGEAEVIVVEMGTEPTNEVEAVSSAVEGAEEVCHKIGGTLGLRNLEADGIKTRPRAA